MASSGSGEDQLTVQTKSFAVELLETRLQLTWIEVQGEPVHLFSRSVCSGDRTVLTEAS